jgi:hypothetical protein
MKPQSAMLGHAKDLVRIEGVRGSNPLSSTEFLQVRRPVLVGIGGINQQVLAGY